MVRADAEKNGEGWQQGKVGRQSTGTHHMNPGELGRPEVEVHLNSQRQTESRVQKRGQVKEGTRTVA